ncbi:MAG: two-component system LytT family response regulator [Cyclobacteriaceae bacterium]|jgi:two-component system LytT family response regulator
MIRTLIIDDEKNARDAIREMLQLMFDDIVVCGEAEGVNSGIHLIRETQPEMIFLDIKMKDGTGFDLLRRLEKPDFSVIFLTAFEQYAVKAFRYAATDYLLKPVVPEDLVAAVTKARKNKASALLALDTLLENLQHYQPAHRKMVLKTTESIHLVNPQDIIRCEGSGNYTHFYTLDQQKLTISKPLKEYDDLLVAQQFMRVHQSHLVNLHHVQKVDKREGITLIMADGEVVPVAVRRKEALLNKLEHIV